MTDLAVQLERLGLEQYLDAFIGEGFDTWETLCDVQESDLETLGVKLGHRRKLQRAIADYRGVSYERLYGSPAAPEGPPDSVRSTDGSQVTLSGKETASVTPTEQKRKYRRHPKIDENAPEKPPSAYVLFSNQIREEVKSENLSFTEIAKLVGDRWQKLDPSQKEPFESKAASLKEQYNIEFSAYKKTDSYRDYQLYLNDFKAKHGAQADTKRPKLDPQSSGGSLSATSIEITDNIPATSGHGRVGSVSSISAASLASTMTSPPGVPLAPVASLTNIAGGVNRGLSALPRPNSPQPRYGRGPALIGQMSSTSSTSDDSGQVSYELSRAANLSLNTPPNAGTPPLPSHGSGSTRSDQGMIGDNFYWPSRPGQPVHQQGQITPSGPSPLSTGITLPSPTFPSDTWRERGIEWPRPMQTSPPGSTGSQPGTLPLPSFLGPDRGSEIGHGHVQRTLPPLRHNPVLVSPSSTYQGTPPTAHLSRQMLPDGERRYSQSHDNSGRQLDRNENEAANTLAGLAARPGSETPQSRGYDRNRPK